MLLDPRNNRACGRTARAGEVLNVEVVEALMSLGADEVHDLPACHATNLGSTARRRHRCFVLRHSPLPNLERASSALSHRAHSRFGDVAQCGMPGMNVEWRSVTCLIFNILTRVHECIFKPPFAAPLPLKCAADR